MICLIRLVSTVDSPGESTQAWLRGDQRLTVGRQLDSDLSVDDPFMSRHHFVVEGTDGGFRIHDLGSRNGTKLNGGKIAAAELSSGDCIRAGTSTLRIEICSDHPSSAKTVDDTAPAQTLTTTAPSAGNRANSPQPHASAEALAARERARRKCAEEETQIVADEPLVEAMTAIPDGLEGFPLRRLNNFDAGYGFLLPKSGGRTIEMCELLGQFYRLVLVVNRSQLDPTCASLLDYLVERGQATAVSQTIFQIDGDTANAPLLQLMRRASRRDAAVCLGFRYTDGEPAGTIAELSHLLCYPSLLHSQLLRLAKDDSQQLFRRVVFFLYEKDLSGDLYLFAEPGFRPAGTLAS